MNFIVPTILEEPSIEQRRQIVLAWHKQQRKTPDVFKGCDLKVAAYIFCQYLGIPKYDLRKLKFRYKRNTYYSKGSSGTAYYDGRIYITICYATLVTNVLESLLHELVHVAIDWQSGTRNSHNDLFCRALVDAARYLWGLKLDGWENAERVFGVRAYGIDRMIRKELEAL